MPKVGDAGTSNDGNTARVFFHNSKISPQMTELDKELIDRLYVILQSTSDCLKIDVEAYNEYCQFKNMLSFKVGFICLQLYI